MSETNARGNRVERVFYADRDRYLYDLALCKLAGEAGGCAHHVRL
jgi:hypothetical protein